MFVTVYSRLPCFSQMTVGL